MNRRRNSRKGLWFAVVFLLILLLAWIVMKERYTVRNVTVEGNIHYTKEEITQLVMKGPFGENSLYLTLRFRNREITNVPFVDVMDVQIVSADTIHITVYEKALAGYVRYMDTNMYFDREGYVVECSDVITEGVPRVAGLQFEHMVLGERLPVRDPEVFDSIMDLTRLLTKYDLEADNIFFHSSGEITLYFGGIKVALGDDPSRLENKMKLLPQFLQNLEGEKGTLRMEKLTEDKTDVSFRREE